MVEPNAAVGILIFIAPVTLDAPVAYELPPGAKMRKALSTFVNPEVDVSVLVNAPVVALTVPPDWLVAVVAVVALVAVDALPLKAAVIVPALKFPEASR